MCEGFWRAPSRGTTSAWFPKVPPFCHLQMASIALLRATEKWVKRGQSRQSYSATFSPCAFMLPFATAKRPDRMTPPLVGFETSAAGLESAVFQLKMTLAIARIGPPLWRDRCGKSCGIAQTAKRVHDFLYRRCESRLRSGASPVST